MLQDPTAEIPVLTNAPASSLHGPAVLRDAEPLPAPIDATLHERLRSAGEAE